MEHLHDMLETIFKLQSDLNDKTLKKAVDRNHPYAGVVGECLSSFKQVCRLPWHDRIKQHWVKNYAQAVMSELGELHETIGWKWWREIQDQVGTTSYGELEANEKHDKTLQNARVECIDMLHFLVSLMMLVGLDAKGTYDMYVDKHQVNVLRQDSGYHEKTEDDTHIAPKSETGGRPQTGL